MSNIWDEGVNYVWGGAKQRKKKTWIQKQLFKCWTRKTNFRKWLNMYMLFVYLHIFSHIYFYWQTAASRNKTPLQEAVLHLPPPKIMSVTQNTACG